MDDVSNRKSLFTMILISISIFSVIFALSLFAHLKNTEKKLNKEKQSLIEENIELKNQYDSIRSTLKIKTEALENFESQRNTFMQEMEKFKKDREESVVRDTEEIELLKRENRSLKDELELLKKLSVTQAMKEALQSENNESVKKVLEDALNKIEMVRSGKSVTLDPIVVTERPAYHDPGASVSSGKVISVDARSNLIAIDLGRANEIREGQRCLIIKDDSEIGSAEIIRVRSKISAAFVDDIKHRYTVRDIRVGDRIEIQD